MGASCSLPGQVRPFLLCERAFRFRPLKRFQAKWIPVRVKKTRQNKRIEPRSDSIGTEKALGAVQTGQPCNPEKKPRPGFDPGRVSLSVEALASSAIVVVTSGDRNHDPGLLVE